MKSTIVFIYRYKRLNNVIFNELLWRRDEKMVTPTTRHHDLLKGGW
ncbi:MAG: hypothetical protein GF401_09250 [Chitinivibrionales bacterium]|nr:hypothetical protein [Chitinivibrionales bacterium]